MAQRTVTLEGELDGADNVYLREFLGVRNRAVELAGASEAALRNGGGYEAWLRAPTGPTAYERRVACVRRYAFGVPNRAVLEAIARYAPIVELGAGTGYWAYLLRNRGVEIVAYDVAPPDLAPNAYKFEPRIWTEVKQGGVEVLNQYADRALFLCWPGYLDTFADEAVRTYAGQTLIYVGEGAGGHTANAAFFNRLNREWVLGEQVAIPQWSGAHDRLSIYHHRGHSL